MDFLELLYGLYLDYEQKVGLRKKSLTFTEFQEKLSQQLTPDDPTEATEKTAKPGQMMSK
jgi:hypothetical protein